MCSSNCGVMLWIADVALVEMGMRCKKSPVAFIRCQMTLVRVASCALKSGQGKVKFWFCYSQNFIQCSGAKVLTERERDSP